MLLSVIASDYNNTAYGCCLGLEIEDATKKAMADAGIGKYDDELDSVYENIHAKVSDGGSNMMSGWKEMWGGVCVAHQAHLSVKNCFMEESTVKAIVTKCKKIVAFFNR